MEAVGVFHDEEWESLSKMFSFEDSDFPSNSNGNYNFFSNTQPSSLLADESSFLPSANLDDANFYCEISQESSNSSESEGTLFAENGHPSNGVDFLHHGVTANTFDQPMHYFCNDGPMAPVFSDDVMQEILQLKAELFKMDSNAGLIQTTAAENMGSCNEMQQFKRKFETPDDNMNSSDRSPKKKPRVSRDAQKSKKGPKKNKKAVQISNDDEENNNGGGNGQSSSTCSYEEDNSNGKGKASRGTATDPQSLYARRRRERINERLRILQNLVPNGTKVDISTMLEEAVHYVKFLQLQIKLLSSDDMWMYAPIAYNGMDMGLYQKIMPNAWPQN